MTARVVHGLPTAAVVRSSQATPARHRGQACAGVPRTKTIAFGACCPPRRCSPTWTTRHGFKLMPDT